jgi:hypothetical protein
MKSIASTFDLLGQHEGDTLRNRLAFQIAPLLIY